MDVALGIDDQSARMTMSWEGRTYQDLYLVQLANGQAQKIATAVTGKPAWSARGKYIYWYEEKDTTWYAYDLAAKRKINLTGGNKIFSDELNDQPDHPSSYGWMGWSKNDSIAYLYDRYDIWKIDPRNPDQKSRVTLGRENQIEYRYVTLDPEEKYIKDQTWFLRGHNEENKRELYAILNPTDADLKVTYEGDFQLMHLPIKAKNTDAILYTK